MQQSSWRQLPEAWSMSILSMACVYDSQTAKLSICELWEMHLSCVVMRRLIRWNRPNSYVENALYGSWGRANVADSVIARELKFMHAGILYFCIETMGLSEARIKY